ncbi:phage holin family protein [Labrys monachus]|uniref:Uncharacterized protein n=1 Tax=Labrys monachus TaxID=217067 RepID=A0ABU0F8B2_9HYPH|nr:phage holin family protein [Labrys monachus]MDQ0390815.1 hypothetical protein [Labrys monachus]
MIQLLALGSLAKDEMMAALRQRGTILVCRAVAGIFLLCLVGTGVVSLHRCVADRYGPYWADAAVAALFAVLAIVALIVAAVLERRAQRRQNLQATLLAATRVAADALPDRSTLLNALVIGAVAGGFWFGRKR